MNADVERHGVAAIQTQTEGFTSQDAISPEPKCTSCSSEVEPIGPPAAPTKEHSAFADVAAFPDGGAKAWTVVFGGWCGLTASFGWISCIGVFQEFYQTHQLQHYTSQQVAWIPGLQSYLMFSGGIWVGRLFDNYGPRYLILAGTFLHVFGLMMASISTEYYQLLLSQGVCSAIGCSMIFYPSMSAVVTWFLKRRALALGIVATGSSFGGIIFPIMVDRLVRQYDFPWAMRIVAFLILGFMIVENLTLVSRITPIPVPVRPKDFVVPFKELNYSLLAVGIFLPFTFITLAARAHGVPDSLCKYLIPILSATSCVGRTVPAFVADRWGRFSVFLAMALVAAVTVLCLWVPGTGTGPTLAFTLIFGFASGAVVSIIPALIAQISPIHQIGVRTGSLYGFVAIAALVGSPIGGQLITTYSYRAMGAFSGSMMVAGVLVYTGLWIRLGGLNGKRP